VLTKGREHLRSAVEQYAEGNGAERDGPPQLSAVFDGRRGAAMVEKSVALDIISSNHWAAIVPSSDGQIAEVVTFSGEPTAETFLEFTRTQVRGRRFRLIRGALTEAQSDALIADIMRSVESTGARESGGPKYVGS
jgi:hypothetical protein